SDLFGFKITRPKTLETTALGAAYLAGLAVGYWKDVEEIQSQWIVDKDFHPQLEREHVDKMQIQSDLFGFKITRPKTLETTALGAAYLAGLAVGYW
ncbi:hypothetical protein BOQ60_24620, partial [Chryseobacterium sp. CH1]